MKLDLSFRQKSEVFRTLWLQNTKYQIVLSLMNKKIHTWSQNLVHNYNVSMKMYWWLRNDSKRNHQINDTYLRLKIHSIYGKNQRYFALFVCRARNTDKNISVPDKKEDIWEMMNENSRRDLDTMIWKDVKLFYNNHLQIVKMALITYICFENIFYSWQKSVVFRTLCLQFCNNILNQHWYYVSCCFVHIL